MFETTNQPFFLEFSRTSAGKKTPSLGDFPDTLAAFLRQQRQPQQHLGCCGIFWHSCRKPSGWEYLEDHPTW